MVSEIKWFLGQTNRNKIEIILIVIIGLLIWGANAQYKENNKLINEHRRIDSLYTNRLNSAYTIYQSQLDECREEKLQGILQSNEVWLRKFEDLYTESDKTYQKINSNR